MFNIDEITNELIKVAEIKRTKRSNINSDDHYESFVVVFCSIMTSIILVGMYTKYIFLFKYNLYGVLISILTAYTIAVFEYETLFKAKNNERYSIRLMVLISVIDLFSLLGLFILPSITLFFRTKLTTYEYIFLLIIIIFFNFINSILKRRDQILYTFRTLELRSSIVILIITSLVGLFQTYGHV